MLKSVSKLRLLVDETRDAYLRGDVNYTIELDGIAERIEQEVFERYMELPLDADGVPIRVGDVLTDGEYKFKVFELAAFGDGSWSIRNEDGNAWAACDVTHHHAPTVEDVLREFAEKMAENTAMYVAESWDADERDEADTAAIAEYAQRLQLREVDE